MSDALQVLIAQPCQDNSDQADSYFCLTVSKIKMYFGFYVCFLREHQSFGSPITAALDLPVILL